MNPGPGPLKGNDKGVFIGVIPSFPAYRTSKLKDPAKNITHGLGLTERLNNSGEKLWPCLFKGNPTQTCGIDVCSRFSHENRSR